ncbi:DNA ligase D [Roseateles terrae]|uniref:DNA ligase (ATP) n=1 Tax=Roseateles terrae TaxID=431060 RepID=A0ABR6GLH1_9BURK|nr:DNA ligase D [Roseateles terrae]MBB3192962.1 bifunctional non-homologous end joining protein LigD [Roseateles terrae]OWQ89788.1 DNA ligase D [Roseateles terrae]
MPSRAQPAAEAPLSRYISKRNFESTAEPKGQVVRRKGQQPLSFVIQKHWASHLHYDFRLELDGVLLSWAVPKGPSYDPRQRRMAVQVEDHPVAYGSFEGTIPPKQYGAGEVIIWDNGTWEPVGEAHAGLKAGKLVFRLHGQKLAGLWQLVRTSKDDAKRAQWLLIKKHDPWERSHDDYDVTMELPDSVVAQPLGLLEVREPKEGGTSLPASAVPEGDGAKGQARSTKSAKSAKSTNGNGSARAAKASAGTGSAATTSAAVTDGDGEDAAAPDLSKARKTRPPTELTPQLATLVTSTPPGDWISEAKLDGYRLLTRITKGRVQLITRGGHDWSDRMPTLVKALEGLDLESAWLDGEVVVLGPEGAPEFNRLQNAIGRSGRAGRGGPGEKDIVYFLFDVPYLQGYDLREVPLRERRRALQALLADQPDEHVRFSEALDAPPDQMLTAACQMRLEGLILKRPDAPYVSARSDTWVKLKCQLRQEFVVVGFTPRSDAPNGLGSLLLAVRDAQGNGDGSGDGKGAGWRYAGRVGTGWSLAQGGVLRKQLNALETDQPHFTAEDIKRSHWTRRPGGDEHWVRPEMVVEVAFAEWTPDGHIRHAAFQGVREDKPAEEIGMEAAKAPNEVSGSPDASGKGRKKASASAGASPGGKSPTKAAAKGATKGATKASSNASSSASSQVAAKAQSDTGRNAKPAAAQRARATSAASSQLRITHPDRVIDEASGTTKIELVRFYESVADWLMPHLEQRPLALVRAPEGVGGELFFQKHVEGNDLIVVRNMAEVLAFTQLNTIELHTWNSRSDKLDKPDRIVFDLDPGEGVAFAQVKEGAQLVRALLEELSLKSWLKTSGGKGLHVVVPLTRRADHETCKAFSRAVVEHLAATLPKRFSAKSGPRNRVGKIFVDYLRNGEGQTTASAFSVRARPGLGVSMPIAWDDLADLKGGDQWKVRDARDHLSFVKQDPWADYWTCRQTLTAGQKMLAADD